MSIVDISEALSAFAIPRSHIETSVVVQTTNLQIILEKILLELHKHSTILKSAGTHQISADNQDSWK